MSSVQELFELFVSQGCRPTERAVPSILSWSPPILPFVCLPDVVRFGLVPSQEVDPRLDVSCVPSCDGARESSPHSLQYDLECASVHVRVV